MASVAAVLSDRGRVADTVEYTLRETREAREGADGTEPSVGFLVLAGGGPDGLLRPTAEDLATRVRSLASTEDLSDVPVTVSVVSVRGTATEARIASVVGSLDDDVSRVVLLPRLVEFEPGAVRAVLAERGREDVTVERAPVGRQVVSPPIALRPTTARYLATFGLAFGFYLALGDPTSAFDVSTGLVSAAVVTSVVGRLTFEAEPSLASVRRIGRAALFLPYLLAAVVRANLSMAAVVLDPRLPIEPAVVRVAAPRSRVGRALLANSITLTPGTLTVDVEDGELVVHTLTAESRADLEAGGLARAVAWVLGGESSDETADGGA